MNAEELESALADKITALGIVANPYPQNPANYVPSAFPGEVLIRYVGSYYAADDVSGVQKERRQTVEIVAVSTELRGESGIYAWLDRIREELEGFVLLKAGGPLELEAEEFMDEYNGTWQFGQRWNINSKQQYEQQDDYADRPLSFTD